MRFEGMLKDECDMKVLYPIIYKDNMKSKPTLKRSKSSENLIFGGITTKEHEYLNLPNPILRHYIEEAITKFKKRIFKKMKTIHRLEKKAKKQERFAKQLNENDFNRKMKMSNYGMGGNSL